MILTEIFVVICTLAGTHCTNYLDVVRTSAPSAIRILPIRHAAA
jgi:hypothetical protein